MRAPSRAASLFALLALGAAPSARADEAAPPLAPPPELTLTWQAPAVCPSPTDVETQFVRLLGGAARVPSGKHVTATAAVHAAAPGRWILELTTVLDNAGGKRNLSGDSCTSVASAAALIMALMIDPAAAERAGAEPAPPPPPPRPAPSVIVAPAPPPPEPPFLQPSVRLFLGGVFLLMPEPTLAAGLAVGARHDHVAIEVLALATTERRAESSAAQGVGGDFRLVAAGARACGVLGRALVAQLCLGGELERLSGVGVELDPPRRPTATMLAGTGAVVVSIPLTGRLALTIDLGVAARAYRPAFTAELPGGVKTPVFSVPAVSASGAAGLSLSL